MPSNDRRLVLYVRLPEQHHEVLRLQAARSHRTIASIVVELLEPYVREHAEPPVRR